MLQKIPPFHPQKTAQKRAFRGMVSIRSATDYSPFGVQLENRNFLKAGLAEDYRMGFQGQEEDDEVKGEGNSVNYKYRMHDPRLGRFFSVDPLVKKYSWYSPYEFSGNKPIHAPELEGMESSREFIDDPNVRAMTSEQKSSYKTGQNFAFVTGTIMVTGTYVVATYGTAAVGTWIIEEAAEATLENIIGVDIYVDPVDVLEKISKQGIKKFSKEVLVEGRKYLDVKKAKDWAFNVKRYGKNLAEQYRKGELSKLQVEEAIYKGKNSISEERSSHIFSKSAEKYSDTKANREMITNIANDDKNYIGIDQHGKRYYTKENSDGTQTYVYTQNGEIKGAGYNTKPKDLMKEKNLKKL
jgi:RHS repeat-associated protein